MLVHVTFEGRLLASYPVHLGDGYAGGPRTTRADFIAEAKRCLLEDGLLSPEQIEAATYQLEKD